MLEAAGLLVDAVVVDEVEVEEAERSEVEEAELVEAGVLSGRDEVKVDARMRSSQEVLLLVVEVLSLVPLKATTILRLVGTVANWATEQGTALVVVVLVAEVVAVVVAVVVVTLVVVEAVVVAEVVVVVVASN